MAAATITAPLPLSPLPSPSPLSPAQAPAFAGAGAAAFDVDGVASLNPASRSSSRMATPDPALDHAFDPAFDLAPSPALLAISTGPPELPDLPDASQHPDIPSRDARPGGPGPTPPPSALAGVRRRLGELQYTRNSTGDSTAATKTPSASTSASQSRQDSASSLDHHSNPHGDDHGHSQDVNGRYGPPHQNGWLPGPPWRPPVPIPPPPPPQQLQQQPYRQFPPPPGMRPPGIPPPGMPPPGMPRGIPLPVPRPVPFGAPFDIPRFLSPPPWHGPAPPFAGRPPLRTSRDQGPSQIRREPESEPETDFSDVASRSEASEVDHRDELRENIASKQRKISQLRLEMSRKRKDLQDLRRTKDDMDNAFVQIFRPHLASKDSTVSIPVALLQERIDQMQGSRDAYYAAEYNFEVLESRMDTLEVELEVLQYTLFHAPQGSAELKPRVHVPPPPPMMPPPPAAEEQRTIVLPNRDPPTDDAAIALLGISRDRPDDVHPLYADLLEAAGDREAAKEYVEELEMNREAVLFDLELELHRKRVREGQGNQISEEDLHALRTALARVPTNAAEFEASFGIPIAEDQIQVLRDYDRSWDRARRELDAATDTLDYLREVCMQKDVMRKNPSYHEELAIYSSLPGWTPEPHDGNMTIDPAPRLVRSSSSSSSISTTNPPSLANPRFPILLSNPSHVLTLDDPATALDRAMRLPKDDPAGAVRRAECMKELGISRLMTHAENTPDYINQWLIQRLRTSPLEAELLLAVCEELFEVVNLRRWQEEVLYYWRLDEAATVGVEMFEGAVTPRDSGLLLEGLLPQGPAGRGGLGPHAEGSVVDGKVNSVIAGEGKVKSEDGEGVGSPLAGREGRPRSVRSFG